MCRLWGLGGGGGGGLFLGGEHLGYRNYTLSILYQSGVQLCKTADFAAGKIFQLFLHVGWSGPSPSAGPGLPLGCSFFPVDLVEEERGGH